VGPLAQLVAHLHDAHSAEPTFIRSPRAMPELSSIYADDDDTNRRLTLLHDQVGWVATLRSGFGVPSDVHLIHGYMNRPDSDLLLSAQN